MKQKLMMVFVVFLGLVTKSSGQIVVGMVSTQKLPALTDQQKAQIAEGTPPPDTRTKLTAIGGVLTFPFKYRDQDGSFEPSFSLSGTAGINYLINKPKNISIGLLFGVGPSSITVNRNNSTDPGTGTRSAATFSGTVLFQWNTIQLAVSIGCDNDLSNVTDKWIYQSKQWLAFGVGFNIFNSQNASN